MGVNEKRNMRGSRAFAVAAPSQAAGASECAGEWIERLRESGSRRPPPLASDRAGLASGEGTESAALGTIHNMVSDVRPLETSSVA